jgi:hypothetical protein
MTTTGKDDRFGPSEAIEILYFHCPSYTGVEICCGSSAKSL